MPRKKTTTTVKQGPGQGEIARLLSDSFDILTNNFLSQLVENKNELDLNDEKLRSIRDMLVRSKTTVNDSSINQLIKLY